MSALTPLFAAIPILRDKTILDLQDEVSALKSRLRAHSQISVTYMFEGRGSEKEQRERIMFEGNLEDAVDVVDEDFLARRFERDSYPFPVQKVRLRPVEGVQQMCAEAFSENISDAVFSENRNATKIEIRVGPANALVALARADDTNFTLGVDRNYHYCEHDFDMAPVDDIGRTFICVSCKHVPKNDAVEPDGFLENSNDFLIHFDELYLGVVSNDEDWYIEEETGSNMVDAEENVANGREGGGEAET